MLSTFVNLLEGSTYQSLIMIFHDETFRMQTYIFMRWIRIDVLWYET
jgi:hypothetical protein